jgi:hypothetical protein
MKTTRTLFMILMLATISVQAQKAYLRVGLGGALGVKPDLWGQTTQTNSGSTTQIVDESKKMGVGGGLPFVLAGGYNISKNFSLELGINYFMGLSRKLEDTYPVNYHKYNVHASMLALVPALVLKIQMDKLTPYARMGLMIGVMNSYVSKEEEYSGSPEKATNGMLTESTYKDKGGISVGAQAAMGVEYALGDMFSLFGEINVDAISWAPKKGKYTVYKENGVDVLGSMPTIAKEWEYVKKIDSNDALSDADPKKELKYNNSFTNVGLVIGVKINFGK